MKRNLSCGNVDAYRNRIMRSVKLLFMTRQVTRVQLARVALLIEPPQSKPSLRFATTRTFPRFLHFSTTSNSKPISQPPESDAPAVDGHEPIVETLSDSMVRIDDPTNATADRRVLPEELSRNVVVLTCESAADGAVCDVYVVGTNHISRESCREVQEIINFIKPQVVFLELCYDREYVLTPQNMELELEVPTMGEMIAMIKEEHNIFGAVYVWCLAKVASKLDVVPGSEFRVAYEEAMKYGGRVILGDRPVEITFLRTWRKMPLWHRTKLLYSLIFQAIFLPSPDALNKREIGDIDMSEFPTLMETVVHEQDQYMSSSLLNVARENSSVVAVVGKEHLQGIKKHWKQPIMVKELNQFMTIPPPIISPMKIITSIGVAMAGIAIVSGIYLSSKK